MNTISIRQAISEVHQSIMTAHCKLAYENEYCNEAREIRIFLWELLVSMMGEV